jgi:hypothetical protein
MSMRAWRVMDAGCFFQMLDRRNSCSGRNDALSGGEAQRTLLS